MGFLTKVIRSWHTFYLPTHRNTLHISTRVPLQTKRITKSKTEGNWKYSQDPLERDFDAI